MELLDIFKRHIASKDSSASKSTVKNYISDIRHFISWFEKTTNTPFHESLVNADSLKLYEKTLGGKIENSVVLPNSQLSTASMKRHLSSLRKFFTFAEQNGRIEKNPFTEVAPEVVDIPTDYWHLDSFRNNLNLSKASKITVKNYISDIQSFAKWYEEAILPSLENPLTRAGGFYLITQSILEDYRKRLIEIQNAAPRTINRKLSSIRKYLSFAAKEGFIEAKELTIDPVATQEERVPLSKENQIELKDIQQAIPQPKTYSKIPPVRLVQKLVIFPYLYLEDKSSDIIAGIIAGKPVTGFTKLPSKITSQLQEKNILRSQNQSINSLLGIKNVQKEFYAPDKMSLLGQPLHKRIIFHARFTRPEWYHKYHNIAFVHYAHLALLVIFASGVGVALYNNLVLQKQQPTFAAPTAPPRILSFQGRLTDANDNPITSSTNLRFAIYNDATASGGALLWQEVNGVVPDQDGIFSIYLGGGTSIPSTVFTDNSSIFLGVSVLSTPELSPRQRIATVGYATNSEFLQGQPPTTQAGITSYKNVILALDSSGNLNLSDSVSTDHTFQVNNGLFKLTGQTLQLATNLNSGGNISIIPDGLGTIDLQKPLVNNTNNGNVTPGGVEVNDRFGVLATESAVAAFIVNNNTTGGDIFAASSSGTTRFVIANDGTLTSGIYNLQNGVLYGSQTTGVIAQASTSSFGLCLQSGISNPTWGACGGASYWNQALGALTPYNNTLDLLVGGQTTASAKFRFLNNNAGTPVASVSANSGDNATFVAGDGTFGTTNRQTLTIGNSSTYNTTGNILINPNGIGKIGIFTNKPLVPFDLRGNSGTLAAASISATTSFATLIVDNAGVGDLITASASGVPNFIVKNNGDVVVGQNGSGKLTAAVVDPYLVQNQKTTGITSLTFQTMGASNADFIFQNQSTLLSTLTQAGQLQLPITGSAGGLVLGGDTQIFRGSADRIDVATGDSINVVSGNIMTGGVTRIDSSGNATFNALNLTGGCTGCTTGAPSPFQALAGVIVPLNSTLDLLVGGQATAEAKFAVLNIAGGTPTASISANSASGATFLSGSGNLGTTSNLGLTVGGSTTGNINLIPGNGLGFATINGKLQLLGTTTFDNSFEGLQQTGTGELAVTARGDLRFNIDSNNNGTNALRVFANGNTTEVFRIQDDGSVGVGTTTPTALLDVAGSASVSGALKLYGTPTIQSTANQSLTFGGDTTGDIILQPRNGGGYVGIATNTPRDTLEIKGSGGTSAFIGTRVSGVSSVMGLQLSSSFSLNGQNYAIEQDSAHTYLNAPLNGNIYFRYGNQDRNVMLGLSGNFGLGNAAPNSALYVTHPLTSGANGKALVTFDQIENQDIFTASSSGTTRFTIANNGTLTATAYTTNGGLLYTNGSGVISQTGAGSAIQCLLGGTTPTWGACGTGTTTSPFQQGIGIIFPNNSTSDFLIGGQSTSSAKFAVLNVSSGTPTATVAGNLIVQADNGNGGFVGIGTNNPQAPLHVARVQSVDPIAQFSTGGAASIYLSGGSGSQKLFVSNGADNFLTGTQAGDSGIVFNLNTNYVIGEDTQGARLYIQKATGNVGVGTTAPSAKLDVNGTASVSGALKIYGTPTIQSTAYQSLTLGGDTTGNINLQPTNGTGSVLVNTLSGRGAALQVNQTADGAANDALVVQNAGTSVNTGSALSFNTGALSQGSVAKAIGYLTSTAGGGSGDFELQTRLNGGFYTSLYAKANGNIGLGTNNPISKLQLKDTDIALTLSGGTGTHTSAIQFNGNGNSNDTWMRLNYQYDTSDLTFDKSTDGGSAWSNILTLDWTAGNVGVGTTTPAAKFDVNGTASISGALKLYGTPRIQSTSNQTLSLGGDTTGDILIQPRNGNGFVGVGNISPAVTLDVAGTIRRYGTSGTVPIYAGSTNGTTGEGLELQYEFGSSLSKITSIAHGTANRDLVLQLNNLRFETGSSTFTERARLDSNGNFGIGTSNPSSVLNVEGAYGKGNALVIFNQTQSGGSTDIFTASSSGTTRFTITNAGGIAVGGTTGSSTQCLLGGSTASWGACASAVNSPFTTNLGAIVQLNTSLDFLAGGQASNSAVLKVTGQSNPFAGTQVGASISANTSFAGLLVDNKGIGDLFSASSSGVTQFQIKNNGSVGIGAIGALPTAQLDVAGNASISGVLAFRNGAGTVTTTGNNTLTLGGGTSGNVIINPLGGAQFGIGTTTPIASIDLRGSLQALGGGTLAVASVSGKTSFAALTIDNFGIGDILTASSSSNTQFVVKSNGSVGIGNAARIPTAQLDVAGSASISGILTFRTGLGTIQTSAGNTLTLGGSNTGFINIDSGSGLVSILDNTNISGTLTGLTGLTLASGGINLGGTVGTGSQCLLGGATASWGACGSGGASPFVYTTSPAGAIAPANSTMDLLIGGQSTASAKFAVLNVSGTGPAVASVSGNLIVMPNNGAGGYVGIGTMTPGDKLALAGGNFSHTALGNPVLKGSFDTSGSSEAVYVVGKYAYVADGNAGGLVIIDISNPSSPVQVGRLSTGGARGIHVAGRYAYIAANTADFKIVDVSNPLAPQLMSTLTVTNDVQDVYVVGKYAYLANNTPLLQIVDVSNPTNPVLVGSASTTGVAVGVFVSGKYAFVADDTSGLQIFDISNPVAPTLVGTVDTGTATDVYVSGRYAYVSDTLSGIQVVDLKNINTPTIVGTLALSGSPQDINVAGDYAYVAAGAAGLTVVNISNPTAPTLVGTYNTPGNANGVFLSGKYAYVADASSGLQVIDINGVTTPSLFAGSLKADILAVSDNGLFGNNVYVENGLNVGIGGILSEGALSIRTASGAANLIEGAPTGKALLTLNQMGSDDLFTASASGTSKFVIKNDGSVGIGTTAPFSQLHVYKSGTNDPLATFESGSGGSVWFTSANQTMGLKIVNVAGADNFTPGTQAGDSGILFNAGGNFVLGPEGGTQKIRFIMKPDGRIGINTVQSPTGINPTAMLQVYSNQGTTPGASISAQTSSAALLVTNDGVGDILVGSQSGAFAFRFFKDQSDSSHDVTLNLGNAGKLNALDVDPPYTIDGIKYSTYAPSTFLPTEEYTGKVTLAYDPHAGAYAYKLDFNNFQYQSDLWVFNRIINPDIGFVKVFMTPNSQARTWYQRDGNRRTITLYADRPSEVSFRLTANRVDFAKYSTVNKNNGPIGLVVPPPPSPTGDSSNDNNINSDHYFNSLTINQQNGQYVLKDANNNNIYQIEAFSKAIVATVKAGLIDAKQVVTGTLDASIGYIATLTGNTISFSQATFSTLTSAASSLGNATAATLAITTDTLTIGGQNIRDFIVQTVRDAGLANSNTISPLAQDETKTNTITPLSDNKVKVNGNLAVAGNASDSANIALTVNGAASISGTLASSSLQTGDATISGTLRVNNIEANTIAGLNDKISSIASNLIASSQPTPSTPSGSFSGGNLAVNTLNANFGIFEQGITSMGPVTANILTATDTLSVGNNFSISNNAINTVGSDLELQSLRQGNIAFQGGLIKMDTDGNMSIAGNMNVMGEIDAVFGVFSGSLTTRSLATGLISPLGGEDLTIQLKDGPSTPSGKLKIKDNSGKEVLSINSRGDILSSGSASLSKLNFNLVGEAQASSLTEAVATGSAGFATLRAGQPEITIKNPNITSKSLIYITPFGDTGNKVLYLLRQTPASSTEDGSFTVGISGQTPTANLQFNWLIVN